MSAGGSEESGVVLLASVVQQDWSSEQELLALLPLHTASWLGVPHVSPPPPTALGSHKGITTNTLRPPFSFVMNFFIWATCVVVDMTTHAVS